METDTHILVEVLILLGGAVLCGTLAEQLKQPAIIGYILAGVLIGPGALGLVEDTGNVAFIANLGIALLLFTLGLEFSYRRLLKLGPVVLLGGTIVLVATILVIGSAAAALGVPVKAAVVIGCMASLSSTAIVLRLLQDTLTMESPHGRIAIGTTLMQDVAVLPLTLLVSALATGGTLGQMSFALVRTLFFAVLLVLAFILIFNFAVPKLLNMQKWARNREFPIILAIVIALGASLAAAAIDVSPAIGAFLAGVMLATSPFATQIRADVSPMRTVLVTLFFASVGMIFRPTFVADNLLLVCSAVLVVLAVKTGLTAVVYHLIDRRSAGVALASGLCLCNVGEFSFVLAQIAAGRLLDEPLFNLVISVTIFTLLTQPYLVKIAPRASAMMERGSRRLKQRAAPEPVVTAEDGQKLAPPEAPTIDEAADEPHPIIIVGFGPAGQRVASGLLRTHKKQLRVVELNPKGAETARSYDLPVVVGSATQAEVLEEVGIHHADAIVITLPDPNVARHVINLAKAMNPNVNVIVRARYHAFRWELQLAGAEIVVDEEDTVGRRLAAEVRRMVMPDGEDAAT